MDRPSGDPLELYADARTAGARPALLESLGPRTPFGRLSLLGVGATRLLELWQGRLHECRLDDDAPVTARRGRPTAPAGEEVGGPADLLARLETGLGSDYFPCWIGFFAYEFARHLGLPTLDPLPGFPDAAFFYYPAGYAWLDGHLVERPAVGQDTLVARQDTLAGEQNTLAGRQVASATGHDALAARAATAPSAAFPNVVLESDYPADEFVAGVEDVQERIRAGWVYQVNLSHRFHFPVASMDPLAFYARLRDVNPSPFMGLLEGDGYAVVSGSPERLFNRVGEDMTARPIAGTRPRSADRQEDDRLETELRASRKEQAEHVMLVDLLRNDLSRVCHHGTVEVSEALTVERYSHVMHLVSEVRGRTDATLAEMVTAVFPGGTITGAPKESVMREIARLEPVPRGAYTGSLGYVSGRGLDFNILIRSLTVADGTGYLSGGGGDVIESDPTEEYLETRHKVEALLHVLGHGQRGVPPAPPHFLRSWRPPRPRRRFPRARVAFLECHDSFSFNIVNYLRMLDADVTVVDHNEPPEMGEATHVVIGPGPGDPWTSGKVLDWLPVIVARRLPFLGVCLGHQALGVHAGAALVRAPRPVHGEDHLVYHRGRGLFAGLPDPAPFTRYNSLHLIELTPELHQEAWTDDGMVMAVRYGDLPAWGVQFHPESMLSPFGLDLLANFLELQS